jgi:hypothetical protein
MWPFFVGSKRISERAALVAQQTLNPGLGKAFLPAPHRRQADPAALGHQLDRPSIRRGEHDAPPREVLGRSGRLQSAAIAPN